MGSVPSGTVSWVDLSTPDIEGAKRFYAELLGWELDSRPTPMGEYVVASVEGREAAGMMAQGAEMAGAPAVWTVFIVVDDLDRTLASVDRAHGSVVQPPFEVPGGARVAVVADRTGAMFGVISGGPEPGHPYFSQDPGAVCWVEVMTGDRDAATGFYREVFGWSAETDTSGPVPYTVYRLDGEPVAGMIGRTENMPEDVPDCWSVYFTVADCDGTVARTVDLGGSVILPPTPTPMGPFAVLADPAGAAFEVMQIIPPDVDR